MHLDGVNGSFFPDAPLHAFPGLFCLTKHPLAGKRFPRGVCFTVIWTVDSFVADASFFGRPPRIHSL